MQHIIRQCLSSSHLRQHWWITAADPVSTVRPAVPQNLREKLQRYKRVHGAGLASGASAGCIRKHGTQRIQCQCPVPDTTRHPRDPVITLRWVRAAWAALNTESNNCLVQMSRIYSLLWALTNTFDPASASHVAHKVQPSRRLWADTSLRLNPDVSSVWDRSWYWVSSEWLQQTRDDMNYDLNHQAVSDHVNRNYSSHSAVGAQASNDWGVKQLTLTMQRYI